MRKRTGIKKLLKLLLGMVTLDSWKYKTMGASMDGGSLSLIFEVKSGGTKESWQGQHMIAAYFEEFGCVPEWIYANRQIVEKRSGLEKRFSSYRLKHIVNY